MLCRWLYFSIYCTRYRCFFTQCKHFSVILNEFFKITVHFFCYRIRIMVNRRQSRMSAAAEAADTAAEEAAPEAPAADESTPVANEEDFEG